MSSHAFLQFVPRVAQGRLLRDVALALMNYYNNESHSRTKWVKMQARIIVYAGKTKQSAPITLRLLERNLEHGSFDHGAFKLFAPTCAWLDFDTSLAPAFHYVDTEGNAVSMRVQTTLGERFPLVPHLDREGVIYPSFQQPIIGRIVKLRRMLVESSSEYHTYDWLMGLRELVAECVSLIDITLHQLYFKAEYDPLPTWKFDRSKLGARQGRRLVDKLRWVRQITNQPFHLSEVERQDFLEIKALRNHFSHFDPPCFCFTIEDAARWLNQVRSTAMINWRIRQAVASPLSGSLVEFLLAEDVRFVPQTNERRLPQPDNIGYGSVRWKDPEQSEGGT